MSEAADVASNPQSLAIVLFSAGGWRFGVEASKVRSSHPALQETANDETATILGFSSGRSSARSRQYLVLKRLENDQEVIVDSPVDLVNIPVAAIHPVPPLLAARIKLNGLRALLMPQRNMAETVVLLVDSDILRPIP